ncbi:MAG: DUF4363 family protein [Clostridia bacterium]|mgnify:CR=1 FL=1|nr:DUF4363 family protein [Clostridia bacterium]
MRVVIVTLITTIFVLVFSIFSVYILDSTATEMLNVLNEIDRAINDRHWESALNQANILKEQWQKNHLIWTILLDHSVIDNIQLSIAHIKAFIISQDYAQVKAEIAGLYLFLKDIPENEKLTIRNVF